MWKNFSLIDFFTAAQVSNEKALNISKEEVNVEKGTESFVRLLDENLLPISYRKCNCYQKWEV